MYHYEKLFIDAIDIIIILLVIYIIATILSPRSVEKFESYFFPNSDCHDCEKCEYDPKVEEIKNKITEWMNRRVRPWSGHLECLNHKKKNVMEKIRLCRGGSSYTIDKEFMYICTKDPKTDEYYDDSMLMHVILHEIAHVICNEIGHTKKFDDIFNELMNECHSPTCENQYQIYDKHAPLVDDYCGLTKNDTYTV